MPDENIEETPLTLYGGGRDPIGIRVGKLTTKVDGKHVDFHVVLDAPYEGLNERGNFTLHYAPRPGFPMRADYPVNESHIIRGEN